MNERDKALLEAFRELDRQAREMRAAANAERKEGVGLLTPGLLRGSLKKKTGLVLAYGRQGKTEEYTLGELQLFAMAQEDAMGKYRSETRGVPLAMLEKSSRPIDVQRSKQVRAATLYKVNKNLLFFSVTGNVRPHYLVRIRLEDWAAAVSASRLSSFQAARAAATGRISFDCACGRHQYWYRYLTHIGGFDVNPPKEQDFPKIRNPGLYGCCCKHVLKVLRLLKSNTIHAVLAKELERQSNAVGFASTIRSRFLDPSDLLRLNQRGEARKNIERLLNSEMAKKKREALKPRPAPKKKREQASESISPAKRKMIAEALRNLRASVRQGLLKNMKEGIENLSSRYKVSEETLRQMMKEEGI